MKESTLKTSSLILLILMMAANGMNYLFQIAMGRSLDNTELYGTLNTLFSILTIISLPATMITLVVSKYIAELNYGSNYARMCGFIIRLLKYVIPLSMLMILLGTLVSPIIGKIMHIQDTGLIAFTIFIAGTSIITPVIMGALQGLKKFWDFGIIGLIAPAIKLLGSGALLALTDWNLYGIMLSLCIGNIITILIGFLVLYKKIYNGKIEKAHIGKKLIIKYTLRTFLANAGLVILTNVDMLIIKHYFDSEAGAYSTSLVFGKMVLYFASAIVVALFPIVIENKGNEKETDNILKKSLIYGGSLSLLAVIALNLVGKFLIILLFGDTYAASLQYILPISIMIFPLSMITILVNYLLALSKTKLLLVTMALGILMDFVLIFIWHETIYQIIGILTGMLFAIFLINLYNVLKTGQINSNKKGEL